MSVGVLKRRLRDERGLTMMELVIAMPMATILLAGLVFMVTSTMRWNSRTQEQATLQTEARATVNTFVADLRQAYLGNGPVISSGANATSITFFSPDKQSNFHLREISYRLSNGNLQRAAATSSNAYPSGPPWTFGAMSSWATEVGSITNSAVFSYYDKDGVSLGASPSDTTQIARVDITLTVAVTTGGKQVQVSTYTGSATLRGAT